MGNNTIITIYLRVIIEPFQTHHLYLGDGEPVVDAIAVMTDHAVNTLLVGVTRVTVFATAAADAEIVDRAPFAQHLPACNRYRNQPMFMGRYMAQEPIE